MIKRLIKFIKDRWPVGIKEYLTDKENTIVVLDGLLQAERQHSQIEMNMMQQIQGLRMVKEAKKDKKTGDDIAFQ